MSEQRQLFKVCIEERNPGFSKHRYIAVCSVCGKQVRFLWRVGAISWADSHQKAECDEDRFAGP